VRAEATDAAVIVASWADPARFGDIFDRHFQAIHRYLARRVGGQLAEDLAAEAFVQAFRARGRYDEVRTDARPWLFGIAVNLLRHHRREEKRRLMAYARSGIDAFAPDDIEQAGSRADAEAAGPQIALALASLRGDERDVLLLFAWADLSYQEIAVALGIPVGTVRSRLNRARKRARELVSANGQYLSEKTLLLREAKEATTDG
jgi:RNA polymerase sigma-70 factor, ECF subfamily